VLSRADEVPASIARLAKAASAAGVPTLSHDDATPAMRDDFRRLGVNIAEFPINVETATSRRRCRRLHRVRRAQCGARRQPYRLDQGVRHDRQGPLLGAGVGLLLSRAIAGRVPAGHDGILSLPQAWALISSAPAKAAGLTDRGEIAGGRRADLLLVDDSIAMRPRIVAVIVQGKLVHLTDATRLQPARAMQRKAIAAA
jgi:alpha-D-ribose 1-methylphosphonate 5-triphosphate diphosphatase